MSKTFKVLRHGVEIGVVDRSTGKLTSDDPALNALYQMWHTEGFRVLGPPPSPPPPGVFADALYTVHPGPDNLGLVAIELQNHGYDLGFDETPPSSGTAANDGGKIEQGSGSAVRSYSRPADRSLAAYKAWIKEMTAAVGGSTVDDPMRDSEDVWERDWREFWAKVDAAAARQKEHC